MCNVRDHDHRAGSRDRREPALAESAPSPDRGRPEHPAPHEPVDPVEHPGRAAAVRRAK